MILPHFYLISQGSDRNKNATTRHRDCLTPRQTNFIYKKVELGSLINKNTMKEELDADAELDRMDDNNGDENPCRDLVVNNVDRVEMSHSPIEQWSILSNVINYVQHSRNPLNFHFVMVKPVKSSNAIKTKDRSEIWYNGDENPCRDLVVNNVDRVEMSHSPIEQWSILSNVINYVQHSRNPLNFHFVMVKPVKSSNAIKTKDRSEIWWR